MNDKKIILILLKTLDQIQQGNQDAKECIEKSITTLFIEEGISFEQVLYILYILFLLLYLPYREFILGQPITF